MGAGGGWFQTLWVGHRVTASSWGWVSGNRVGSTLFPTDLRSLSPKSLNQREKGEGGEGKC